MTAELLPKMSQSWPGDEVRVGPPESLSVLLVRVLLSSVLVQCVLYFVTASVCIKPLKAFFKEEVILKFYYRFYLFYCYSEFK